MGAGFAHVHNHEEWSQLDGWSRSREAAARAAADGNTALAITDHGTCAGHPEFQDACLEFGLNPMLGLEAYFRPDRLIRPAPGDEEARKRLLGGSHLILLAQGDRGLRDLWDASTESYATGFYNRPRMDWEVLEKYGSDWTVTTACLGGIVSGDLIDGYRRSDNDAYERAFATLDRLKSIFGDRLYLEIQANDLPDQLLLNKLLAEVSDGMGIKLVAACDAHYADPAEADLHAMWMRCRTGKGKENYWHLSPMLTEERVRETLLAQHLDPGAVEQSIRSTAEIAERCTARIGGHYDPPVFTRGGTAADDARMLRELCERNWDKISHLPGQQAYRDRMEFEYKIVTEKDFAGCYLIVNDIVSWVRSQDILVGPGRGSAAGSLMSCLLGITSINPLPAGLMFERFLTPGRASMPDFDLDFPSSKRDLITNRVVSTYGADHVVRVGTALRYKAKGILKKLFSIEADSLPGEAQADSVFISKIISEAESHTAGLGLPWDDIIAEPTLQQYIEKYPKIFEMAGAMHGRIYSYGQHPGGLIISPQMPLAGTMPMRRAESGSDLMVSQWDYRIAEKRGLLKLDLLTVNALDRLQLTCELVARKTGQMPDPRSWDTEHDDPQVWDALGTGETLTVFQAETTLGRQYCKRHKPRSLAQMADLTTYVRPGPRNSGATESYLRRHFGQEEIDYPHPLLEEHLKRTYGVMLYQEDIITAVRVLGGYNDLEADGVRKILGKKLTDKIAAAGEEFTERCVARGHDREQIEVLWSKIAEFGKYAFNRAHAFSYSTFTYWTAWFKEHWKLEDLTSVMSTADEMDRVAEYATEARRVGITVLPPDVRFCGADFTYEGLTIRYGLSAIHGVGPAAIGKITRGQPYTSLEDFRGRSGVDAGVMSALARAGALDALVPSRRGLVQLIESQKDGSAVRCIHKDAEVCGPNGLPCTYDWANEPQPPPRLGARGKPLKVYVKPAPLKCTVGCRRYTPPESLDLASVPEYSADELFRMEYQIYGCWMSPRAWEQLEERGEGLREEARRVALMLAGAPEGTYPVAAIYAGSRIARTARGSAMWWVTLVTEVSAFDLACFSPRRDDDPDVPGMLNRLRPGTLVSAEVIKRSYRARSGDIRTGWNLAGIWPLGV